MTRCLSVLALTCAVCCVTSASADEPNKKGEGRDPEAFFKKLDGNNDGKISKAEFSKFFEQMAAKAGKGEGKGGFADKIFEKLDANNDGNLTKDEMKQMAERFGGQGAGKGKADGKGKPGARGDGKGKGKPGDGKGKRKQDNK